MKPAQMLGQFSPSVLRKARKLADSADGPDSKIRTAAWGQIFPQAWAVTSSDGRTSYDVHLVCEPGEDDLPDREIHGAMCRCPNGRNSPLGAPRCYHVAAVLLLLAQAGTLNP